MACVSCDGFALDRCVRVVMVLQREVGVEFAFLSLASRRYAASRPDPRHCDEQFSHIDTASQSTCFVLLAASSCTSTASLRCTINQSKHARWLPSKLSHASATQRSCSLCAAATSHEIRRNLSLLCRASSRASSTKRSSTTTLPQHVKATKSSLVFFACGSVTRASRHGSKCCLGSSLPLSRRRRLVPHARVTSSSQQHRRLCARC